ncbi:MAG: formylmethanofuran--tetrahydromethanopterin N-formyltransferase [Methanocellales archaeon]|nr:formylmethanofuran--tetrahydromethanopterin N-formyltransferase [Methanocellales archaeon]
MALKFKGIEIEDTYSEAFDGFFSRILVTADDDKRLYKAAFGSTTLPSTVLGESEGGIEKWLNERDTPDGRKGAIVQIWTNYNRGIGKLEYELAKRIRQGILVVPTTRVFNALESKDRIDIMNRVGHCGDGYECLEEKFGREVINIPIMMGGFIIERYLGCTKGVMGGTIWFFCETQDSALEVGDRAVEAVSKIDGAITPFDVCSAGSKVETKYPEIGPTTNHPYCPTLKDEIPDSMVPGGVASIPEIVINGTTIDVVKEAMRAAIRSVAGIKGVVKISAGNYGGKLGKHKIWLRDVV